MYNKTQMADTLKKIRKLNKLSVNDVCYLSTQYGYPLYFKSLYKWETGKSMPDLKALEILCHIYNIHIYDLLKTKACKKYSLSLRESNFINALRFNKKYKKILLMLVDYKEGGAIS